MGPSAVAVAVITAPRRRVRMYPWSSRETEAATASAVAAFGNVSVRVARDFMGIAPGRFELPSRVPKTRMLDRYTTGLRACISSGV